VLSLKTLSSPTISGTIAGSPTTSGQWTFSGSAEPIILNRTTAPQYSVILKDNGTLRGYVGCSAGFPFVASNSATVTVLSITEAGLCTVPSIKSAVAISTETTGTLTSASANTHVACTGNITLNNSVFAAGDKTTFDPGTSARTFTRGSGIAMYVNGIDSASATLAANQMGGVHWRSASVAVLSGAFT